MTENKLLITDDLKSAFADLTGRNPVNEIKIEGKQIPLQRNPVHHNKENIPYIAPTDGTSYVSSLQPSPGISSSSSSVNVTPKNTSKATPSSSSSSSTTPNRGSVLASYIERFRSAPASDRNQRNTKTEHASSDFWWIKNSTNNHINSQRPNTAPNPTYSQLKPHENQSPVTKADRIQCLSQSVRSSISDASDAFTDIQSSSSPKAIEYTPNIDTSHESHTTSKLSSVANSPKASTIHNSPEIKEQDAISDKTLESSPHYFGHETLPSFEDNDANIDVDDILEKWRKKRRLKQLATENGMSPQHDLHCKPISDLLGDNESELDRIKKRLGLSNEEISASVAPAQVFTPPTQPFTATIHPISFAPQQHNTLHYYAPPYSPRSTSTHVASTTQPHEAKQSENYPTTPKRKSKNIVRDIEDEGKEEESIRPRTLSPRRPRSQHIKRNKSFLTDQQYIKEQRAKSERLARIQRRMCCDEKKVLDHTKSAEKLMPPGRQKKIATPSPSPQRTYSRVQEKIATPSPPRNCNRVQKKLEFEEDEPKEVKCEEDEISEIKCDEKDAEIEEHDVSSPRDAHDEDVLHLISKSVQTQPDVITPKMSKTQSQQMKSNIMGIEKTKPLVSSADHTELLPDDILNTLHKLHAEGVVTNEADFDAHFRKILSEHRDHKEIADKLLKFMTMKESEDTSCDEKEACYAVNDVKRTKAPLPSPKAIPVVKKECDDDKNDNIDFDERANKKQEEKNNKNDDTENKKMEMIERDANEEKEHKMETDTVLTMSLCCDISNMNINDDYKSNDAEQDITPCNDNDGDNGDNDVMHSESDMISSWIQQHPAHYWPPSKQSDSDVIRDFVDGINVHHVEQPITAKDETESGENESTLSICDDVEIMTLMQSCKKLRNNISDL